MEDQPTSSVDATEIPKDISLDEKICEPEPKKRKVETKPEAESYKLEEKLNGILCCAVCLDLPNVAVYQCSNGHLMCVSCQTHLLADARLKDETATCPNCRCEISKSLCTRNLAVEKAISELPSECRYCCQQLPRCGLEHHEREQCQERLVSCRYERIGCPWRGPFHELPEHQDNCTHPTKSGLEIMDSLKLVDQKKAIEAKLFSDIFTFLSFEKVTFSDLQLRPYRTDDFITKLFYETSRFSAFNMQWVVKASISAGAQKSPNLSVERSLQYQLVLKSKPQSNFSIRYLALRGPYSEMKLNPALYEAEFSQDSMEGPQQLLPLEDSIECNKQLSAKTISMRLILFQVQK